ncbi:MAG: hypothetical protein GDA45_06110 [Chromatiales bacterium]|nr:hypothetical protein [Chromatiales bacterium]
MNIYGSSIGVEISPSAVRIAQILRRKGALQLTAVAQTQLCYDNFDDLYKHPKECSDVLNDLCTRNNIQASKCITVLPVTRSKSKCIALPLMRRRALQRMLSSRHFWYKHLTVGSDTHSYAWLMTVNDKKHYRLSLYLMAVAKRDIAFYQSVFAGTQLSLYALTLSSLIYYGCYHRSTAHHLLVFSEDNVSVSSIGQNVFSYRTMLADDNYRNLLAGFDNKFAPDSAVQQYLVESLQEYIRSEKGDAKALYIVGKASSHAATLLHTALSNIAVKPLAIHADIKSNCKLQNIPDTMSSVIALARWLAADTTLFRYQANFIYNHNNAYYKSAACWILATIICMLLFFYHQHLEKLNIGQQSQLQYHTQLSSQYHAYENKLNAIKRRSEHLRQMHTHLQFLSEQHRMTTDLWSRLGALIPQSVKIQSIDCQWLSSCLIIAGAQDYGEIIRFVERIKQLDAISEVVISSSRSVQNQSTDTMQFTLVCKFGNGVDE